MIIKQGPLTGLFFYLIFYMSELNKKKMTNAFSQLYIDAYIIYILKPHWCYAFNVLIKILKNMFKLPKMPLNYEKYVSNIEIFDNNSFKISKMP